MHRLGRVPPTRSRGPVLFPTRDRPTGRLTEPRGCMKPGIVHNAEKTLPPNHSGPQENPSSTTDTWGPPAPRLSSPSATGTGESTTGGERSALGVLSRPNTRIEPLKKPPDPVSAKQGQAQGTLSLVHPQPLGQILKRHQHNRIIAPHQRRLAHPGPHRPTLAMLQLHHQIRQCIDARKRA